MIGTPSRFFRNPRPATFFVLFLGCWMGVATWRLPAADPSGEAAAASASAAPAAATFEKNTAPHFNVVGYTVEGNPVLSTNVLLAVFSKYAGPDVSLEDIGKAASDLQLAYRNQGYPAMSVAVSPGQITNGIITMNVFQAVIPQIVVAGRRYPSLNPGLEITVNQLANQATNSSAPTSALTQPPAAPVVATNVSSPSINQPVVAAAPASAEALAQARAVLLAKMAEPRDTRIHVISTNAGPRFEVEKYVITGNTVLPPKTMAGVLTNIDGAFGTNVSFDGVRTVLTELQGAYHERGYVTVSVGLPQQKLTNATVKLQVTEGRLAVINVKGNRYFSSNNVLRSLPSLHTNMVLNGPIFSAELARANANQDRQIYPVIGPGPDLGTSDLTLNVKDQLPLHGKVELNDESSPGTPDLRLNTSAVYNNLWDLEHSLGVQYSFSPQAYKTGNQWDFYDKPLVANYSAFYRLPLGSPAPLADEVAATSGSFGYDEATRKFNLPATTGQPDFNIYASRSTIDTGVTASPDSIIQEIPGFLKISQQNFQEDLTVDEDEGARLSLPLPSTADFQSGFSGGPDFKTYDFTSYKTNAFYFTITTFLPNGQPQLITSTDLSPVPATYRPLQYLPFSLNYNATWRAPSAIINFGLGSSFNTWFSGSTSNLQAISESKETTGYWAVLTPSLTVDLMVQTNWLLSLKASGQWANQPLISNEQFGAGGVNSVPGYHEGEVFGDTGWRLSIEQHTPVHTVGTVFGHTPLTIRGSVYMDVAETYLLDPQGRAAGTELWSTGFGLTGAVGPHWEARFLFSVPLIGASDAPVAQPYFNFALSAQF